LSLVNSIGFPFTVSLFYSPAIRPVHLGMSDTHLPALLTLGLGIPSLCHSLTIPELRCQIAGMFRIPVAVGGSAAVPGMVIAEHPLGQP